MKNINETILLIYNPVSGTRSFASHLDAFIDSFQQRGYEVHPVRSRSEDDFKDVIERKDLSTYSGVFIAGGDGSVNMAINKLIQIDVDIPLGIIPAGTVNDISYNLGIPQDINKAIKVLSEMKTERFDIGKANDRYFMNSCGAGLFIDVAHTTERELKNIMGRVAYYLKGISELPNFKAMKTRIVANEKTYNENIFLFLVVNGKSVGGFRSLASDASMQDGLLDFIGIKECQLNELSVLFAQILLGNYKNSKNVLHFKSDSIWIECLGEYCQNVTDVDGERGPSMPLEITMKKRGISIVVP
ncbi:MAG TPA: diacylglycerol kinase [Eubacteriaceae bacterium]|jgi:YegS/Rv2252/BmrU family lipid kinase|nr:diacylglycerol kinase [Eubacteriaceae bacterium]